MKKKLLLFFLLIIIAIISINNFKEKPLEIANNSILKLRKKHANYLQNSPFKHTLKLTKSERRAIQLPPNKYYEREWELTMNPLIGRPEPYKVLNLQKKLKNKSYVSKVPGDVLGNSWVDRGPNNVGGRTRVVLFDPNDATNKRVFAGGVSGGLWVNQDITDINSPWTLVSGVPSNMNISCITVDPRNFNIWYIGTGEQYTFGAAVGNGVYKTTDGGTNWTNITVSLAGGGSFVHNASNTFLAGIYYINDIIAWDNGTSTEIFIGVGAHSYGDASNPSNWLGLQSAGLYRSTDNGTSWSRIESTNMQFTYNGNTYYFIPNDFEISLNNTLWMGTITTPGIGGGGGGRIFNSTNGVTWSQITTLSNSNRVELAVSSINANKMYALTQGTTTTGLSAGPHIFSTINAFASTTELAKPSDADNGIPSNDFTRGQAFYDLVIEVDPTNDNIVYVGGIDLFRTTQGANTNLASEWKQISKWSNNPNLNTLSCSIVHADQHAFTFRPGSSNEAVIGGDGGVYYATSLSTAQNNDVFIERNKDYNVTQFYYGGYGQSTSNELILAGAQDNGSQFINGASAGANSSVRAKGGDGAYSTIDKDGNYMIASYVYSNHEYFKLPYPGGSYIIDNNSNEGDFITAAGLDHNLNIMYSNGSSASKAINRYTLGSTSATKSQLTNALLDGSPTAFKVSPYTTASTTLLIGTDNGKLLKLTKANQVSGNISWENITGTSFVGSISSVEFGETENDIFVTFHNYGVTNIWYTSNGGVTWKNKEGDLPDMPIKCILQNPLAKNEVIIGTELGIWSSINFNEDSPNWTSSTNGMRDVKVVDLDLRTADNSILATTFGRGTFTGQFTSATSPTFTISSSNSIVEVCKPNDAIFNLDFTALGGYNTLTTFSTSGEPTGATINFSSNSLSTTGAFTMTVGNIGNVTAGEYAITVTGTGAKTISTDVILRILDASAVVTTSPTNEVTGTSINNLVFTWEAKVGATSYDIDIATDPGFNTIIETGSKSNNSYTSTTTFNLATVYYWRVRAINICATGNYSATQKFQTAPSNTCNTFTNNTSISIPDGVGANLAGSPATSIINVTDNVTVSDINVTMNITHSYIGDLVISLIAPDATEIILFSRECNSSRFQGINITYDDEALATITCASPVSGTYIPTNSLAGFKNKNSLGNWTLKVVDNYNGDVGTINSWSIEVCEAQTTTNSSFVNNPITVGTNSTYILKQTDIEATSTGSIASEQVFMITELPTVGELRLNNTPLLLGQTFTQDDINTGKITFVNTSSITVTDLFKVDITNVTNGFLPNQQVNITIDSTLGVDDDFFEKTGISVFPTISNGSFFISSQTAIGKTDVEIYTITGQKVYSKQLNFNKGDVERIHIFEKSSGIYILKLISDSAQGSKKIIIR